jgi:acetyl-CoA acyltransferase
MATQKTNEKTKATPKRRATPKKASRGAVIVGGVRTPFLRSFGRFTRVDTIALGVAACRALIERYDVKGADLDGLVWGGVILPSAWANIAREIALDLPIPRSVEATTVTRVCTSGLYAITTAAAAIERGEVDLMIAGGGDSTSNAEIKMPQSLVHKVAPVAMSKKSTLKDYLALIPQLDLKHDLLPEQPSVRERTTGELMGESAERMATRNGIPREAQDAFAVQSHARAAAAIESGRFAREIVPVFTARGDRIDADDIVRGDATPEKLAKLRPAFARGGTLTAANSTPLTDGASAVLLMSEERARALGYEDLVAFRGWSYDAVDPADQMLLGPAISMPRAAKRAGMTRKDIDLIDIHEAFAAQVLCVLKMLGSDPFARERLGDKAAFGQIAPEEINVHGGSIALGHPFGATGARIVTTMRNELALTGKGTAMIGICGGGGLSAGAVMERLS